MYPPRRLVTGSGGSGVGETAKFPIRQLSSLTGVTNRADWRLNPECPVQNKMTLKTGDRPLEEISSVEDWMLGGECNRALPSSPIILVACSIGRGKESDKSMTSEGQAGDRHCECPKR